MTAPGAFSSGDVLTAADMNALPAGVVVNTRLGGATITTTTITAANQNILVDGTTLVAGRKYFCAVKIGALGNSGSVATVRARIFIEGSRRDDTVATLSTGHFGVVLTSFVFTAAGGGGNHYVDIDTNTGSVDLVTQDDVSESSFVIVDLGTN